MGSYFRGRALILGVAISSVASGGCSSDSPSLAGTSVDYVAPCMFQWSAEALASRIELLESEVRARLCKLDACTECDDPRVNVDMHCPPSTRSALADQSSRGTPLEGLVWKDPLPPVTCAVRALDLSSVRAPESTGKDYNTLVSCELMLQGDPAASSLCGHGAQRPNTLLTCQHGIEPKSGVECPAGTRPLSGTDATTHCEIVDSRVVVPWSEHWSCLQASPEAAPELAITVQPGVRLERDAVLRAVIGAHLDCTSGPVRPLLAICDLDDRPGDDASVGNLTDVSTADGGVDLGQPDASPPDAGSGGPDCSPAALVPFSAPLAAIQELRELAVEFSALERALDEHRGPALRALLVSIHEVEPFLGSNDVYGCQQSSTLFAENARVASQRLEEANLRVRRLSHVFQGLWWSKSP